MIRNRLSKWLVPAFAGALALLIVALVDSFGQMAYAILRLDKGPGIKGFLGVVGLLTLLPFAQRIKLLLDQLPQRKVTQVPLSVLASLAGIVLGGALLIALSIVANALLWQGKNPSVSYTCDSTNVALLPGTNLAAQIIGPSVKLNKDSLIKVTNEENDAGGTVATCMSLAWTGYPALASILLAVCFGRSLTFLNLSSHSTLYSARLTRAYHGASNPKRWSGPGQNISDAIEGDDIWWDDYNPHAHGGPLHIVNATLNETVGGKSQIQDRDRHGMIMALGPAGISVGARFHALRVRARSDVGGQSARVDFVEALPVPGGRGVSKPEASNPTDSPAGPEAANKPDASLVPSPNAEAPIRPLFGYHPLRGKYPVQPIEALPLSRWIGISGAAFSTGLGRGTSLGTSLIAGMANIRLGYWWDSYVRPSDREDAAGESLLKGNWIQKLVAQGLPVQAHLFDEFLAQFRGPNNRLWYLSDGGHFENTGAYELIRRRVPWIIICDCGADPDYKFEDLATLVRLVRIDFDAEVEFISPDRVPDRLPGVNTKLFGKPEDFLLGSPAKQKGDEGPHALLAEVKYPKPEPSDPKSANEQLTTSLLVLKPSISGDEPLDILQYHSAHPSFPQEPTADQFFNEAQWESYRKLGRHIAKQLFVEGAASRWFVPNTSDIPIKHSDR